jgi:uncharacterized protein YjbI with pentapeptide repeats
LPRASLRGARLVEAVFESAELTGADLRGAYLTGAQLPLCDLGGADLRDAVLKRCDLRGADLRGALLDGALLDGALLGEPVDAGGASLASRLSMRAAAPLPSEEQLATARWRTLVVDGVERARY